MKRTTKQTKTNNVLSRLTWKEKQIFLVQARQNEFFYSLLGVQLLTIIAIIIIY